MTTYDSTRCVKIDRNLRHHLNTVGNFRLDRFYNLTRLRDQDVPQIPPRIHFTIFCPYQIFQLSPAVSRFENVQRAIFGLFRMHKTLCGAASPRPVPRDPHRVRTLTKKLEILRLVPRPGGQHKLVFVAL